MIVQRQAPLAPHTATPNDTTRVSRDPTAANNTNNSCASALPASSCLELVGALLCIYPAAAKFDTLTVGLAHCSGCGLLTQTHSIAQPHAHRTPILVRSLSTCCVTAEPAAGKLPALLTRQCGKAQGLPLAAPPHSTFGRDLVTRQMLCALSQTKHACACRM